MYQRKEFINLIVRITNQSTTFKSEYTPLNLQNFRVKPTRSPKGPPEPHLPARELHGDGVRPLALAPPAPAALPGPAGRLRPLLPPLRPLRRAARGPGEAGEPAERPAGRQAPGPGREPHGGGLRAAEPRGHPLMRAPRTTQCRCGRVFLKSDLIIGKIDAGGGKRSEFVRESCEESKWIA